MKNILIVEDELLIQLDLMLELEAEGFKIFTAETGEEAIEIVENEEIDCVLMDIKLKGDMNGIDAGNTISEEHEVPIIYCTSNSSMLTPDDLKLVENLDYIKKPFNIKEISEVIYQRLGG